MDSQEDRLIKASLATQQTASHTKKTCRFSSFAYLSACFLQPLEIWKPKL